MGIKVEFRPKIQYILPVSFKEQLEHFSFDVEVKENLDGQDLIQAVDHFAGNVHSDEGDCLLCVVTGYMYNGYMYGRDGIPVLLHELFEPLRVLDRKENGRPEIRRGKMKLIFVDAYKVRENIIEELDSKYANEVNHVLAPAGMNVYDVCKMLINYYR